MAVYEIKQMFEINFKAAYDEAVLLCLDAQIFRIKITTIYAHIIITNHKN